MQAQGRRVAALAAAAVAALGTAAITGAGGAGAATSERELRERQAALETGSRSALLELYAMEANLAAARDAALAAARRVEELEAEGRQLARRLEGVRRDAGLAEAVLAQRVRALYERRDVHPLAVLLGASSLDEAVTGLEHIRFAVEGDRRIVTQTRAAHRDLQAAAAALAKLRASAELAAAAAGEKAAAVERAHAERAAHVARLADEQRLNAARIAELERQARAAQERAGALAPPRSAAAVDAAAAAPAGAAEPAPATPAASTAPAAPAAPVAAATTGTTLTVVATAYALPGRTATGMPVGRGVVAVDPAVIPLGTRMSIPGYGDGVAADVGGAIKGLKIDVWLPTRAEALRWGRRTVTITLG